MAVHLEKVLAFQLLLGVWAVSAANAGSLGREDHGPVLAPSTPAATALKPEAKANRKP